MTKMQELPTAKEVALHDAQVIADRFSIPVIWCDHQATRRQRLHGANVPGRPNAYTSTHMTEILFFLDNEGWECGIFICETPQGVHYACQIDFTPLEFGD